jgi:hypothetical protein
MQNLFSKTCILVLFMFSFVRKFETYNGPIDVQLLTSLPVGINCLRVSALANAG